MNKFDIGRALMVLCLLAVGLSAARASAEEFTPVYSPTLEVSRLVGEIKIDGSLDDSGWRQAAQASNFSEHEPGDQVKPPVDTKVYLTYDEDHIYVGWKVYDDPAKVRATVCGRDRIHSDDNVGFFVDTYGDATWAYTMNCNPFGIQYDALWSAGNGEDDGYDLIWESKGHLTDFGFEVEMAIPFSSLRFPNKEVQTWKVDFWRNHPRETRREYSWAAYDRDESCWPCQWGSVTGIQGVKPGRGVEILPSVLAYQSGVRRDSRMVNDNPDGEVGVAVKYSVTSDITAELTYNPDFSQIEADATQIDVNSTTALSYQERRPFFQEGSDLFQTVFGAVYTRSINDPQVAAKVTGRLGRTSFAYLGARDEHTPVILPLHQHSAFVQNGRSSNNVFRLKQTVAENSHLGLLVTDRRLDDGGSNTLLSFDGSLRLSKYYSVIWQGVATHTKEPDDTTMTAGYPGYYGATFDQGAHTLHYDGESYWGDAAYFGINREDRNFDIDLAYLHKSPTFRADNGYQPTNDRKKVQFYGGYSLYFDRGIFQRIHPNLTLAHEWDYAGDLNQQYLDLQAEVQLSVASISIHPWYRKSAESYRGVEYTNLWLIHNCFSSTPTGWLALGGGVTYSHNIAYGDQIKGKETMLSAWLDLRPTSRLFVENWFNYAHGDSLEGGGTIYDGYTVRSRGTYQFSRELALRLVVEYDDFGKVWSVDPLLTYQINPFSVLYAGSSYGYDGLPVTIGSDDRYVIGRDWQLSRRQFFLKLKYLFQV
ncbi:MAG: DUF5916 domain-containing protein [bacterium]